MFKFTVSSSYSCRKVLDMLRRLINRQDITVMHANLRHLTWQSARVKIIKTVTNSSFQNYTHPDDHTTRTTDTPGFKPFTMNLS